MGACAILPRIIGHGRAAELLFTGRSMSAEEGERWGFFSRIADDVHADAQALAAQLADGPIQAHSMTKRQLDAEWTVSIETAHRHGSARRRPSACRPTTSIAPTKPSRRSGRRSSRVTDWLDWPFFEPRHRELAERVWTTGASDHRRCAIGADVDAACRSLVASLGQGRASSSCAWPTAMAPDVRSLAIARAMLAAAPASPISPSPCRAWDRARSACSEAPAQKAEWLPKVAGGEAIAAFAMTEPETG